MRTDIALVATALAVHSLGAAVVPARHTGQGRFSLEIKARGEDRPDFLSAVEAVHRRWGKVKSLLPRRPAFGPGETVHAKPIEPDRLYLAEVEIGTPPQRVNLAVDTGSPDVWVQSSDTAEYRTDTNGPRPRLYLPANSSTCSRVDGAVWNITYEDGNNAAGVVYRDTLRLGGLQLKDFAVESAQKIGQTFEKLPDVSGFLGLAKRMPTTVRPGMPSLTSTLGQHLEWPVFTVDLRRNASSRLDLGYVNRSMAEDKITWIRTVPQSVHWDVQLGATGWNDRIPVWIDGRFVATVDTGTSLLLLPREIVRRYWRAVPGARQVHGMVPAYYKFPCKGAKRLPDFYFKLPRTETLPGTAHILRIPGPYLKYAPIENDPKHCWGGLQSSETLQSPILGLAMLRALFVAFDIGKNRVGFANKRLHDHKWVVRNGSLS